MMKPFTVATLRAQQISARLAYSVEAAKVLMAKLGLSELAPVSAVASLLVEAAKVLVAKLELFELAPI